MQKYKIACCIVSLTISFLAGGGAKNAPPPAETKSSSGEPKNGTESYDRQPIRVSSSDADAAEPAAASAPDASVYVVWVEHRPEKQADVFIRHFDGEMKSLGEAVRVNPEAGQATAWRGDPPTVKVGADGTVYVGWTARVEVSEGSANDLYLSVSRDGGKTFDAPVKVNDDKIPAVHGMHSLEVDKTGRIFFAWLDERFLKTAAPPHEQMPMDMSPMERGEMKHKHGEPNREVYFAASIDGGKSFSPNKKLADNVCPCCKTSMTAAPDERLYISWRQVLEGDFRHIAVASSIDGGNSFSPAVIISDDKWQISACPVSGAGMMTDDIGNLQIVWFTAGDAGTPGIYQTESKDGGKTFSPRILVSDKGASGMPTILQDEDGKSRIVFSATDRNTYSLPVQNASVDLAEENRIGDAELESAAVSRDKIFVAFVRRVNGKRNVFFLIPD